MTIVSNLQVEFKHLPLCSSTQLFTDGPVWHLLPSLEIIEKHQSLFEIILIR